MNFNNSLPEWNNTGTEPSDSLKNDGFKAGYKPSANVFNWFWSKTGKCIKELQEKLSCAPIPLSGVCTTAKGTTGKVVTCPDFKIYDGARIAVTFNNGNSANYMTLNVNGTGAYFAWFPIGTSRAYNNELISKFIVAGCTYEFIYQDGATPKWVYCGMTSIPINDETPTYTEAEERDNLASGEKLSTAFGKIKKFFADLKTVAFTGSYTDLSNKPTSMQNPNSLTLTMNGSATNYNGSATASKSWYAPTSGGPAGYNLISNGSGAPVWQQLPYAVCNTSGSTVAKTVSITNFKLVTGVRVFIKFTYAHDSTTKATLNVNNTGAKSIRYKGYGVFKGYNGGYNSTNKQYPNSWEAGEIVEFIYDGTEWVSTLEKRKIDHSNIVVGTINVDGYRIPPSINDVDFMCGIDGKSDVEVIQEAINASRNGSRIILKKGNYSIDAPIYMYGGNHATKLSGEHAGDRPTLNFSNNGIITSRSSSSDSKASYSLYFENIAMELIPQLCIEAGSIYFDNVFSRLDVTTAQNLGSTPIKSSGLFKVKNGSSIDLWIRSSSSYICYCGIDCTKIEIDDSSISLQNECSSTQGAGGDDLNFIYNTNATGYIRNSKLTGQGNGRTNFINGKVTIDECDITLKNRNHSLCHYTTDTEQKLCSLRDCTINYTASTYLTFGKIEGCFFVNTVTGVNSSENYKLQILCPTQMIGNTFIGRSEMNFNSNKVQFIGNAMQYSQSYTSFPTGSVNTGTMITG